MYTYVQKGDRFEILTPADTHFCYADTNERADEIVWGLNDESLLQTRQ